MNNLLRDVKTLIADVTEFMTLRPGDLLLTGVAYQAPQAMAGDHVIVSVSGFGEVSFTLSPSEVSP